MTYLETPKQEDFEELFYQVLENLRSINPELADRWEKELDNKIDNEEITHQEACAKIQDVIAKRSIIESGGSLQEKEQSFEFIHKGRKFTIDSVKLAESMTENFLGNGSVADVYSIPKFEGELCVKIVKDQERYVEGNNIHQEGRFLSMLSGFEVDNVRTPILYHTYFNLGLVFLVQEELDAVNFRRVLEGHEELPDNFNTEEYFSKLKNYILALHEKGIYHQDFVIRNFMIDRQTAKPYVIDFGRAVSKDDIMGEKFDTRSKILVNKDLAGLQAGLQEARESIKDGKIITLDK